MNNQIVTSNEVNIKLAVNLGNDKPVFKVSGRCLAASISYSAFILCSLTVIFFIVMENTNSQFCHLFARCCLCCQHLTASRMFVQNCWKLLHEAHPGRIFHQNKNVPHVPLPRDCCSHPGIWIDATIRTHFHQIWFLSAWKTMVDSHADYYISWNKHHRQLLSHGFGLHRNDAFRFSHRLHLHCLLYRGEANSSNRPDHDSYVCFSRRWPGEMRPDRGDCVSRRRPAKLSLH